MRGYYGQADYRFRIEPFFELMPSEWKNGHFTASLRYEEKDTDEAFVTAIGDEARLTVGLNFRPLPPYVLQTSFAWFQTGASGTQPHLWSGKFLPEGAWIFDAAVAYLF
jgi:hypothetical protein